MDTVKALDLDPIDIPPADNREEPEDLYDEDDPGYDYEEDQDAHPRFD